MVGVDSFLCAERIVDDQDNIRNVYLFDPLKKCIQSNNETILDQGTPIKVVLAYWKVKTPCPWGMYKLM